MTLALKYRPKTFDDITGQSTTIISLKNAIESGHISHAYLFFGSRGVGKTSMARILARSLNCSKGPTASACGECDNCLEIASGDNMDVIEMDAASNRGINHIRELRGNTRFTPMKSKYKIYIIDEVHMLTNESFNALLKTLEEPPSHVIFILATTEKHKIPETILSRCQNYVFRKFTFEEIIQRLKFILNNEKVTYEEYSLMPIAQKAEGSMRDAISLTDQVIAFSSSNKIKLEDVHLVLGLLPFELFLEMLNHIRAKNLSQILGSIEKIYEDGYNLKQFIWDFLEMVKNAYLVKIGTYNEKNIIFSESQYLALQKELEFWKDGSLQTTFDTLYKVYSNPSVFQGSNSNLWRISLEMAFLDIFQKLDQPSVSKLVEKIAALKDSIKKGKPFEEKKEPMKVFEPEAEHSENAGSSNLKDTESDDINRLIQKEFMGREDHSKHVRDMFESTFV